MKSKPKAFVVSIVVAIIMCFVMGAILKGMGSGGGKPTILTMLIVVLPAFGTYKFMMRKRSE